MFNLNRICVPYANNIKYYFHSDHGGSESVFGDKFADETSWNFDDQDTDSVWGSTALNTVSYALSSLLLWHVCSCLSLACF